MDINIEKALLVGDISCLSKQISSENRRNETWGQFNKFKEIVSLMNLMLNNSNTKPILINLWNKVNHNWVTNNDASGFDSLNPEYSFFKLLILTFAFYSLENIKLPDEYKLNKEEQLQIINQTKILSDLKSDDISSTFTNNGAFDECTFDIDEYIRWATKLSDYVTNRLEISSSMLSEPGPKNIFPENITFDDITRIISHGKHGIVKLTPKQSLIFSIYKRNFGNILTDNILKNNGISNYKQVQNLSKKINKSLSRINARIEFKAEGKGIFLDKE